MELKFAFGWRPHAKVDLSQLVYPPLPHLPLEGYLPTESVIEQILKQDYFLYYPYHTMEPYIALLREAATSPKVISIKITLYRVDRQSRVIEYLRLASENGKEVTVIIELGARFDEENNLYMAKLLRDSGCNVLYGVENYKVHSKITLLTLKEGETSATSLIWAPATTTRAPPGSTPTPTFSPPPTASATTPSSFSSVWPSAMWTSTSETSWSLPTPSRPAWRN